MKTTQRIMDDLRFFLDCDDAEIARRCGVKYGTVRNASTGARNTGIETVRAIVEGCGYRLRFEVEHELRGNDGTDY